MLRSEVTSGAVAGGGVDVEGFNCAEGGGFGMKRAALDCTKDISNFEDELEEYVSLTIVGSAGVPNSIGAFGTSGTSSCGSFGEGGMSEACE